MEAMDDFPDEYSRSFQICFDFMNTFNVRYLEDDKSFLKKNWRFFYIVPAVLIHITAMTVHLAMLLRAAEMAQVAYLLPAFLVTINSTLKVLVVIPKTRQISAFIKELGGLWRTKFTKSQSKHKNALIRRINLCNRVTYWITVSGTFQYLLSPLLETLVRRFILQQNCELLLPIASSYPFNPLKNWLIYIVVYILQCYTMFLLIFVYMGSELIMITLCALLGIEFLMLKGDLYQINSTGTRHGKHIAKINENHGPTIKEFVKRHQIMIRLSRQLDNIFNRLIFIGLLFVGITTCAFSFAGEFSRGPTYMVNNYISVAASMLNVLYLCYYGELLTDASASIGDLAYENLWYKGDKQHKIAIWLIIKISQKPCCLTSLRYAVVSLNLFTKVLSTTWSYFSLMNTVYSEE